MLQTLLLTAALLSPAQPPAQPPGRPQPTAPPRSVDWHVAVQLEKAQEMIYRGTFSEECTTGSVQYQRSYRVESRILVLDATPRAAELACMTILRAKDNAPIVKDDPEGRSIRVERFRVDSLGKLSAAVDIAPPLEGPATVEVGYFAGLPAGKFTTDQSWETFPQAGQPSMTWTVTGADTLQNVRCPILKGVQQSPEWDQPRGDRKAWRRVDTVWVAPRTGVALKVERVLEVREPAHKEPTQKSVFKADLESTLPYPGQLFLDRQGDILQAIGLRSAVQPLLATPGKYAAQFTALHKRIVGHLESAPPTPYRQAILQVKAQIEAGLRGEVLVTPTTVKPRAGLTLGGLAPDFVTSDMTGKHTVGLKQLRGQPVVLAFYNPNSTLAPEMLQYLAELSTAHAGKVWVLPLSVNEDAKVVAKQLAELKLSLPVLQGSGLRITYEVETTPKIVLLDGQGYVRGSYLGWGRDIPGEILSDLKPWLPK